MANLTITNSFSANTVISSSQMNTNFSDVKTWLNNRDNATDYWLNMKVSGTASNPAEIKSSSTDCEFDVDCTGSNGTPRYSLRRSGTTYFTWGVDGASSNLFKMGTTALTTNVAFQIPTTGVQVQFASGLVGTPSIVWLADATTGLFRGGAGRVDISNAGVNNYTFAGTSFSCAQPLLAADGSASNPSISLTNATTSGLFKQATNSISIASNGVERLRCDANGNIINTAGTLATNATNGFTAITTCAGAATGTPAAAGGGNAFLQYDSTNHKLYVYDSSWRSIALT